jgi:adenylate cyclase
MGLTRPPPSPASGTYVRSFGGFAFDPSRGVLLRPDGAEVELRPKSVEVLCALVERGGQVVGRQVLMRLVWPDVFVTDDNITQCITEIRRALGKEAPRLLHTLPKRGYLLVCDNGSTEPPMARNVMPGITYGQRSTSRESVLPDRPSLVVLPFTNLSNDLEQEYFSDGMTDEIIAQLARSRSLFVIARSSSFSYKGRGASVKEIARELGVRYVLEGSVRRGGGRVRVNAQLAEAETEIHIWADRYDRELTDVFSVQDEITRAVATEIAPAISVAERERAIRKPSTNLSAWEAYQRGLWHVSRGSNDDVNVAAEFFRRSVVLDPLFAEPHAMLARFYLTDTTQGSGRPMNEGRTLAESAARAALRLDPDNASAYASLAWIFDHRGNATTALEQAERAIALNVNDPTGYLAKGHVLLFMHRGAEARLALATALRLDPRGASTPQALLHLAISFYLERDHVSAAAAAGQVTHGYPDFARAHTYLAASLGQLGRGEEACEVLREAPPAALAFLEFRVRNRPPWWCPEDHEHLLEGLRKAGWRA